MSSRILIGFAFFLGAVTGWLGAGMNELHTLKHVAEAYVGDVRRVDLALRTTRFWITRDLDSKCEDLSSFIGTRTKHGKVTKTLKLKGSVGSQRDYGLLEKSTVTQLNEYQKLMDKEFSVDLHFSFKPTASGFECILEFIEK